MYSSSNLRSEAIQNNIDDYKMILENEIDKEFPTSSKETKKSEFM